jgi:hypothetical protein
MKLFIFIVLFASNALAIAPHCPNFVSPKLSSILYVSPDVCGHTSSAAQINFGPEHTEQVQVYTTCINSALGVGFAIVRDAINIIVAESSTTDAIFQSSTIQDCLGNTVYTVIFEASTLTNPQYLIYAGTQTENASLIAKANVQNPHNIVFKSIKDDAFLGSIIELNAGADDSNSGCINPSYQINTTNTGTFTNILALIAVQNEVPPLGICESSSNAAAIAAGAIGATVLITLSVCAIRKCMEHWRRGSPPPPAILRV